MLDSNNGQWSEWEVDRAWGPCCSKARSQLSLANTLSRRHMVVRHLSLLQVYLRFWRCISRSLQELSAAQNCRMRLWLRFRVFLSRALKIKLKSPSRSHLLPSSGLQRRSSLRKAGFSKSLVGPYTAVMRNEMLESISVTVAEMEKRLMLIFCKSTKLLFQSKRIPPLVPAAGL